MSNYDENKASQLAAQYINNTNKHIFLTGKAGTGKTTFLRNLIQKTYKNTIVVAPTGIAAINAGGVTIHSQFQLPFGTFVPSNDFITPPQLEGSLNTPRTLIQNQQMGSIKRKALREVELLVIDEVSMLRADILDAMDTVLRRMRRKNIPFGGLQILFIGDLLQLPPVVKQQEEQLLRPFYKSIFFFNALALRENPPVYIELDKIYRQSNPEFIAVLNNLRQNLLTPSDKTILNKYVREDYESITDEHYIFLTTHNQKAATINTKELVKLKTKPFLFDADVSGDFPDKMFPVDTRLTLKEGAQVMFIKNDYSGEKKFFNGKIGTVFSLSDDKIIVEFPDSSTKVEVEAFEWENKQFKLNEKTAEIEETVKGRFKHFPLRLAWAITIHKSQGLTFTKAIIDLQHTFAPGQIYVALSRLTSLDGLVLTRPLHNPNIRNDASVANYLSSREGKETLNERLDNESKNYVFAENKNFFDFAYLGYSFNKFLETFTSSTDRSRKQKDFDWAQEIQQEVIDIMQIGLKFSHHIAKIAFQEDYKVQLVKRITDAQNYFEPLLVAVTKKLAQKREDLKGVKGVKTFLTEIKDLEGIVQVKMQKVAQAAAFSQAIINHEVYKKKITKFDTGADTIKKDPTHIITFQLFKGGLPIKEIAKERHLVPTTIETHLAKCVEEDLIPRTRFISDKDIMKIVTAAEEIESTSLSELYEHFGESRFSYFKLRLAVGTIKE
jgi:DNA-binding NarL/FixJ family response regulator